MLAMWCSCVCTCPCVPQARICREGAAGMALAERARLGADARLPPAVCGARARAEPPARRRRAAPRPSAPRPHQDTDTHQGNFHGIIFCYLFILVDSKHSWCEWCAVICAAWSDRLMYKFTSYLTLQTSFTAGIGKKSSFGKIMA